VRKGTNVLSDHERLLVRPRRACHLLDCGTTRLYELIDAGELQSFLDGASRKITVESIRRYIAKHLASATEGSSAPEVASADSAVPPAQREPIRKIIKRRPPRRRRPGQPTKTGNTEVLP
jgi:hypothetical protein